MDQTLETKLERVLEILHYEGDKGALIRKFLDVCKGKTAMSIMEKLGIKDNNEIARYITDHQEEYFQALEKESTETFKDYFKQIIPHLTLEEKQNLTAYLDEVAR